MARLERFTTILLVEDDPGDAELVNVSLRLLPSKKQVVYVTNLADALQAKNEHDDFDVILLDLSLPDSFGFSTVTAVRDRYPTSPIVILTGLDDPNVENQIVEFGAQDYLVKGSFDDQNLRRAIEHAIVRHKLEQQIKNSEAEHRAIINLVPDAILVVSKDGRVNTGNPAALKMFGFDQPQDLTGQVIESLMPDVAQLCTANTQEPEFRGDGLGMRGGRTFPVAMAIARLPDDCLLVLASDITERVQMASELRALARTDTLTGLANRRAFIETVEVEFQRCKRSNLNSAVVMVDIDHFKKCNDMYGHDAGDRALVALAKVLTKMVRATDLSARLGGEEFVLLLTDVTSQGAMELAERIRYAVSEIRVESAAGVFGFTVSLGVTCFDKRDAEWSDALKRADTGLYEAKNTGRNRVVLIQSSTAAPSQA